MPTLTDSQAKSLIDTIETAEKSGSVTPEMVASVLDYLKKRCDLEQSQRLAGDTAITETLNLIVGRDTTTGIDSLNEIVNFLAGIDDGSRLKTILADIDSAVSAAKSSADTALDRVEAVRSALDTDESYMLKLLKAIAPDTSFESLGEVMAALGDGYDSLVALASTVKTLVGATVSQEELIKRWNEIEAWLNGVTDSDTLSSLLESQRSQLTADIDAVRAKAEEALSGATVTFDTAIESAGTVDPKLIATASAGGGVVLELNTSRFLYRSASGIYFAKWTATDGVDVKPRSAYYDGASVAKSRLYLCRADGSVYSWSDGQKLLVRVDMAAAADAAEAKTIANAALSKSRRRPLRVNPLLHRGHIHVGASKGEVYQWHGFVKANLCVVKGSDDTRGYVAWDDESETVKIDLRRFAGFIATAPVVTVVERGDDRSPDTFTRIQSSWDPLASTMTLNVPQGSRRERRTALIPLTGINHRYVMIGADNQLTPAYGVESVGRSLPPADVAVVAMLEDALANGTSFGSLIASLVNRAPCDQTPRWEIAIRRRRHTLPKDADSIADHLHIVWKRICGNGISSWANPGNALYVEGKIPRMTCGVLRMRRVTAKGWLRSPWVYVSWCRLKGSDKFHYKVL